MYKGDGVIVGVFDTGIDWDHLDFRNPADTTKSRILKLWDQTITPIIGEVSPSGFNYGVEYTQAQINNELDGSPAGYVREKDLNGHGTHVAGTAAGNGAALSTRKFAGVAPNADIVIVKGGNGSFSDYNEINAMTYFQNVANAFGKPIVVNMSIGGQFGAHDGSNPDEIAVDDFCNSAPGRVACISAGNDNGKAIHTQLSIAANGTGSVVINVPTASGSSATDVFQISLYVNDTSSVNATITLPNGSTITANAGQSISPNVLSGAATAYFDNYIDADSKDRLINLYVVRSNTSANPSGAWTITFT
ncbi:MAG: S8 family serine peptidase, partial [Bacteroidetes bacterium]|nr:S8 family serine peptidase [Bacteroidota bacterium]